MALLRGINVGGKNLLPMTDLARLFEEARALGANLYPGVAMCFFTASRARQKLPGLIASGIADRGVRLPIPVLL